MGQSTVSATTPRKGKETPLCNIANALTVTRLILVPVFIWLMLQSGGVPRLWATIVFMVAALTDQLDGHLARSWNLVTNFGKIADPIADKALTLTAFILLSVAGILWWWVTVVILVRELGITALRFVLLRRNVVMPASMGGKLKTTLQMLGLVCLLMPWSLFAPAGMVQAMKVVGYVAIGAALLVTVATGVDYVVKALRLAREAKAAE
ncbi:Putative CDP-diacylglycerol--glycerol-3-phosphate 3-phosphatidyl-transferase 2 [Actinomyces bovis]|uniref:CDP-diacylglycerol--glycerol-3-phosphate 3-phosphatidyltransferase n=1 Tax=Actinomyces bovis TaxID=1658 RepID=A0ABY1VPP6_9ACTO|nr:CDP-diacylglycerol--glycerol-3-phosphate 3-phosphatidyltransferase [Actinomyces bovis]SPT53889.1 Putative CDP-diacylglycerol--glycerol-3-phosphate 3-phosphatidyl-transferase 2 [Actinomyces bovis]VEG53324.1 Putative CDP-diacylglycerol--glycerol-3-phosphate 3-phosphatidyl-transferase 2 [Actinomyces israelii]